MQTDMHYCGTYAMAIAAGLAPTDAHTIATASQLVDDNNFTTMHYLSSGQAVLGVATAHHALDAGKRVLHGGDMDDSRLVWVPFHFLPGGRGDSFEQQIVCVKNGPLAREMVSYYLRKETIEAHRGHVLQLMGIAAHVYADTFSHYGFSGITSQLNDVDAGTIEIDESHSPEIVQYLRERAASFMERFVAQVAGAIRLGHGAVATYPDRPYLKWSYLDTHGHRLVRDNRATYLEACEALHRMFCDFRAHFYAEDDLGGDKEGSYERSSFASIRSAVSEVLSTEADGDARMALWSAFAADGRLGSPYTMAPYSPTDWIDALKASDRLVYDPKTGGVQSEGYNFLAAAEYHRNYVLKRLLPESGLFVA